MATEMRRRPRQQMTARAAPGAVPVAMTTATRQRILMMHTTSAAMWTEHVALATERQRRLLMTHSYGRREGMRGAGLVAMAARLWRGACAGLSPGASALRPTGPALSRRLHSRTLLRHGVRAAPLPGPPTGNLPRPAPNERG